MTIPDLDIDDSVREEDGAIVTWNVRILSAVHVPADPPPGGQSATSFLFVAFEYNGQRYAGFHGAIGNWNPNFTGAKCAEMQACALTGATVQLQFINRKMFNPEVLFFGREILALKTLTPL